MRHLLRRPKALTLSATELKKTPQQLSTEILAAQQNMKDLLDKLPGGNQYIVGDGSSAHWLLRDSINLSVEVADAKGSFTVVDLPGMELNL